jgi:hypothetical protein
VLEVLLHDPSRIDKGLEQFGLEMARTLGQSDMLAAIERLPEFLDVWLEHERKQNEGIDEGL